MTTACGDSGYQYVENEDLGVYARLPDDWSVYDADQMLDALSEGDRPEGLTRDRILSQTWLSGFDGSNQAGIEDISDYGGSEPRGYVQVQQLSRQERDMVNVSSLRGVVLGVDPLAQQDAVSAVEGAPQAEVLVDEPKTFEGGYHGVHNVFAVPSSPSSSEVTIIDQTAVLDETNSALYLFVVSCDETCYLETHTDTIEQIVESWTVQEARS